MAFGETIISNPNYAVLQKTATYERGTGQMDMGTNEVTISVPMSTPESSLHIYLEPENTGVGFWSWETFDGYFVVTSDRVEPANVPFTWDLFQSAAVAASIPN